MKTLILMKQFKLIHLYYLTLVKGALSGLRPFLASESPAKVMTTLLKKKLWRRCFPVNVKNNFSYRTPPVAASAYCPISREVKAIRQLNLVG